MRVIARTEGTACGCTVMCCRTARGSSIRARPRHRHHRRVAAERTLRENEQALRRAHDELERV